MACNSISLLIAIQIPDHLEQAAVDLNGYPRKPPAGCCQLNLPPANRWPVFERQMLAASFPASKASIL